MSNSPVGGSSRPTPAETGEGSRRLFVSLSKGRTSLGFPDDLPLGAHPVDWYLIALRDMLGSESAARYLGVPSEASRV